MADKLSQAVQASLITHNGDTGHAWTFGTNWDNKGKEFETYVNKYLFPKLNETLNIYRDWETDRKSVV